MGMYYKLSSTMKVDQKRGILAIASLAKFKKTVLELFKEFKSDQGHRHSVAITENANGVEVELSYSEYGPYSMATGVDDAWKKFCKENADFSAGPVECSSVNDDAPDEEDRETIWYIGPADAIIRVQIDVIDREMKEMQEKRAELEKKAKNAGSEIIDTEGE